MKRNGGKAKRVQFETTGVPEKPTEFRKEGTNRKAQTLLIIMDRQNRQRKIGKYIVSFEVK